MTDQETLILLKRHKRVERVLHLLIEKQNDYRVCRENAVRNEMFRKDYLKTLAILRRQIVKLSNICDTMYLNVSSDTTVMASRTYELQMA